MASSGTIHIAPRFDVHVRAIEEHMRQLMSAVRAVDADTLSLDAADFCCTARIANSAIRHMIRTYQRALAEAQATMPEEIAL
jgi:hypothetical protein